MAVTYNQVLKTATIDTKQLTDEAIADTSTSRNGSLAIAQFDAEQIIKLNGGDDGVLMIPFHAIDNVVVEQTTQEATKPDPVCDIGGGTSGDCTVIFDGDVALTQDSVGGFWNGTFDASIDADNPPQTINVTMSNSTTVQTNLAGSMQGIVQYLSEDEAVALIFHSETNKVDLGTSEEYFPSGTTSAHLKLEACN